MLHSLNVMRRSNLIPCSPAPLAPDSYLMPSYSKMPVEAWPLQVIGWTIACDHIPLTELIGGLVLILGFRSSVAPPRTSIRQIKVLNTDTKTGLFIRCRDFQTSALIALLGE